MSNEHYHHHPANSKSLIHLILPQEYLARYSQRIENKYPLTAIVEIVFFLTLVEKNFFFYSC